MAAGPRTVRVPVPGGDLVVHVLAEAASGAPTVVALHGISSNGLAWQPVADALEGRVQVLAPDLRGRAESGGLRSTGLADHARDVLAVAEAFGLDRPVLAGHSMGAFVAALAAATYPHCAGGVVLVDGGLAFPTPSGQDVDTTLESLIGPAMARLRMTFADEADYLAHWRTHPALGPFLDTDAGGYLTAHLLHDLTGEPGARRSSTSLECVRADWGDVSSDPATLAAIHTLQCPARLFWVQRGLLDEPKGLYSADLIAAAHLPPDVLTTELPTNHYGPLLEPAAVGQVALAIRELAGAG